MRALKLFVDAEAGVRPAGCAYLSALAGAPTNLPRAGAFWANLLLLLPAQLPAMLPPRLPSDGPLRSGAKPPLPMPLPVRASGRALPRLTPLPVRGSGRPAGAALPLLTPLVVRVRGPPGALTVRGSARPARPPLPLAPSVRASRRLLLLFTLLVVQARGALPLLPPSLPSADRGLSVAVQPPPRLREDTPPGEAGGTHSGLSVLVRCPPAVSTGSAYERRGAGEAAPPRDGVRMMPAVLPGGLPPLALLPERGGLGWLLPPRRGREGLAGMEAALLLRESSRLVPLPASLHEPELGVLLPRCTLPPGLPPSPFSTSAAPGLAGEPAAGAVRRRRVHHQ